MDDQWTFQCEIQNVTPFATKPRPTKRPPNPTDLGRTSDETACLHMDQ